MIEINRPAGAKTLNWKRVNSLASGNVILKKSALDNCEITAASGITDTDKEAFVKDIPSVTLMLAVSILKSLIKTLEMPLLNVMPVAVPKPTSIPELLLVAQIHSCPN